MTRRRQSAATLLQRSALTDSLNMQDPPTGALSGVGRLLQAPLRRCLFAPRPAARGGLRLLDEPSLRSHGDRKAFPRLDLGILRSLSVCSAFVEHIPMDATHWIAFFEPTERDYLNNTGRGRTFDWVSSASVCLKSQYPFRSTTAGKYFS